MLILAHRIQLASQSEIPFRSKSSLRDRRNQETCYWVILPWQLEMTLGGFSFYHWLTLT